LKFSLDGLSNECGHAIRPDKRFDAVPGFV
jgi:hypothetical protein